MRKILLIGILACSCAKKEIKAYIPSVEVVKAEAKEIPLFIEAIGHLTAYNSCEIKAQVEGRILDIHYTEGREVKEGDLLISIDPRPYEAMRDKAIAMRAQNSARLQFTADKVSRYETLLPDNFVSALDYTQYVSDMLNYEAAVLESDAEIREAEINLDYCYIKAPFTGITSKQLVDKGNLVVNNSETLVTINQLDPIYVDFSVPEKDFLKLMHYQRKGNLDVEIGSAIAKLIVVDNQISEQTGMIPLRAELANQEKLFWPGQFIRAKVILQQIENAIMVPVSATNLGQKGMYAYVISDSGIAEYRAIKLGEQVGNMIQITSGIKAGETVVTNGQINVLPGMKVNIVGKQ